MKKIVSEELVDEKKYEQITNYVTTEADDFHVGHQALFRALSVIPKTKR